MDLIDVLTILSFVISLENLSLNEKQIDDLQNHLKRQDEHLTQQDETLLNKILENQETIIRSIEELRRE